MMTTKTSMAAFLNRLLTAALVLCALTLSTTTQAETVRGPYPLDYAGSSGGITASRTAGTECNAPK